MKICLQKTRLIRSERTYRNLYYKLKKLLKLKFYIKTKIYG